MSTQTPSSKDVSASRSEKVTKATVISFLTFVLGSITYFVSANPAYGLEGALIGYAIGDVITFLQSNTLGDNWQYATKKVLLIGILSTVGLFVGQLVSTNIISSMLGSLIGYAIAEAIFLLEGGTGPQPTTPTPPTSPGP